jgi:hypothetical protein
MRFLAHNEEKEEPDENQNRASRQGQCTPGKKYERKTGKHYHERDDVNNHCAFITVHNTLPIFDSFNIPQASNSTKYYLNDPI